MAREDVLNILLSRVPKYSVKSLDNKFLKLDASNLCKASCNN
jgi:hypothetical protein